MCGIVGTFPNADKRAVLNGIRKLKHRGPDHQAFVKTPNGTLGHTRLSIIDVKKGHQPMMHEGSWIVFNGEVYNFQKLRRLISGPLKTQSDTEVILHLYNQFGPESISLLDGMFALAIKDGKSLFLARDPLGIKPLYYAVAEGTLYFASEIKALFEISNEVKEFPAGHWWHAEYGLRKYYQLNEATIFDQQLPGGSLEDNLTAIKRKLQEAVDKRMIADADVPVGVSLSGGLDSSIVAAFARDTKDRLNTFVVGMPGSADLAASQEAAKYLGTSHHVYEYTFKEMIEALPEVIYHLESFDAPLIRSAIPNYFLAKLASEHVKVILTGEGADELYAGYQYLDSITDSEALQNELFTITGNLHNTNLQRADRMSMAHSLEARVPFLDKEFVDFSLALPAEWKLRQNGWAEKEILRRACKGIMPEGILNRSKKKFSDGAGSIDLLAEYANERISDQELIDHQEPVDSVGLRSKEELLYYQIFKGMFKNGVSSDVVGRTRSIVNSELH